MTVFAFPSGAALVTFANYAISLSNHHGSWPPFPIPLVEVAATMRVSRDIASSYICDDRDRSTNTSFKNSFSKGSVCVSLPGRSRSPLLPFASLRWRHLNLALTDLVPVGAQGRSATLNETFHHDTPRVVVGVPIYLLEETVERHVPIGIRIFGAGELLIVGEDFGGNAVPVLVERLVT